MPTFQFPCIVHCAFLSQSKSDGQMSAVEELALMTYESLPMLPMVAHKTPSHVFL